MPEVRPAAIIAPADISFARLVHKDREIKATDGVGLRQRWEFGRDLLSMRRGKKLPDGILDKLVAETGRSRSELQRRVQFAEKFDGEALSHACDNGTSWFEVVTEKLPDQTGKNIVASDENEWYTPKPYTEAARRVLGGIDLDPASSDLANQAVGARQHYRAADDGLSRPWSGRLWLNPPYGRLAGDFIGRLLHEHNTGNVTAAIALVNAHCTDTSWFQGLWNHVLCFTDHRIDFEAAGREKTSTSTHGSVFAYLGNDYAAFKREFEAFGPIVRRA